MSELLSREAFQEQCLARDDHECIVPYCGAEVDGEEHGDVHHIVERSLWDDGGYYMRNGASVCSAHHMEAEANAIPPQQFWYWLDVQPLTPYGMNWNVDKWGESFETPPHAELREYPKYPSTGHLPFSPEWDGTRVDHTDLDQFTGIPLVATYKMDGSNAMLVKDTEDPVRARNGSHAKHQSFDMLKDQYWEKNVYEALDDHTQVFGEWLYAKHSIHYGCDGCCPEEDEGPAFWESVWHDQYKVTPEDTYFQIFGVFNTKYNLWLSWPEVEQTALDLGFATVPVHGVNWPWETDDGHEFYEDYGLRGWAEEAVRDGHEGLIMRNYNGFHYGQFTDYMAKYVREGHVQPNEEHWSHREIKRNHTYPGGMNP